MEIVRSAHTLRSEAHRLREEIRVGEQLEAEHDRFQGGIGTAPERALRRVRGELGSFLADVGPAAFQGRLDPSAHAGWARRLAGCAADVLVVGHTHQVFAERLGGTLVVNPGSTRCRSTSIAISLISWGTT